MSRYQITGIIYIHIGTNELSETLHMRISTQTERETETQREGNTERRTERERKRDRDRDRQTDKGKKEADADLCRIPGVSQKSVGWPVVCHTAHTQ